MTFPARSSRSKISTVAIIAIRPATLACTKGSLRLLANAGTRTFFLVLGPSIGASRPRRIQVFVRIEGSVSVCILAKSLRRSLLRVRSFNLDAKGKIALTVASRMTGTVSANPVIWNQLSTLEDNSRDLARPFLEQSFDPSYPSTPAVHLVMPSSCPYLGLYTA